MATRAADADSCAFAGDCGAGRAKEATFGAGDGAFAGCRDAGKVDEAVFGAGDGALARGCGAAGAGSGAATATTTGFDVSSVAPAPVASDRLCAPGGRGAGIMTNWPVASVVASATVLPSSLSSTLAWGAARPATTASPVGSTDTTSKDGLTATEATAGGAAGAWVWAAGAAGAGGRSVTRDGTGIGQIADGRAQ